MPSIEFDRKQLTKAIDTIARVAPTRSHNPALRLLTMTVNGAVMLRATNLDVDAEVRLPLPHETTEGVFATDAGDLKRLLKGLKGDSVTLDFEDDKEATLTADGMTMVVQGANPTSAPQLTFPEPVDPVTMPASTLLAALDVLHAAAVEDYQAVLRGVCFEFRADHLRLSATDGFRLAYQDIEVATGRKEDAVCPARSLKLLLPLLRKADSVTLWRDWGDPVSERNGEVTYAPGRLHFEVGGTRLSMALMDGTWPDYQRIIPQRPVATIQLDAQRLVGIVERVGAVSDQTVNNRVDFDLKEGRLTISAAGARGEARQELEVQHEGEPEGWWPYNHKYLLDALKPIDGTVTLGFSANTGTTPTTIRADGRPGYLAMLVPLRTG